MKCERFRSAVAKVAELEASLMRDDSTGHVWKKVAADQETEAEAEAVLKAMLNITE